MRTSAPRQAGTRTVAFHVHTNRSFDSLVQPEELVRACLAEGVHTLCVTDHDTIDGALAVRSLAMSSSLQVIVGAEYKTDLGDVIGLCLREEIRVRDALSVVEAIRAQGGIAILPHPFHAHSDVAELSQAVDAIEVFNGRCSLGENEEAFALATQLQKPMLAGSDAHFLGELSNVVMRFTGDEALTPGDFLTLPRSWQGHSASPTIVRASQGVKGLKTRSPRLAGRATLAMLKHALREALGKSDRYFTEGDWSRASSSSEDRTAVKAEDHISAARSRL